MDLQVRLGPPIIFVSGSYRADFGGYRSEGPVICDSLSFLGGQTALPSVGGVFRLQDSAGHTIYRVSLPATQTTPGNHHWPYASESGAARVKSPIRIRPACRLQGPSSGSWTMT